MPDLVTRPRNAVECSLLIPKMRALPLYAQMSQLNAEISMVHPDVLALLHHFAGLTTGDILELGPYVGGTTIAMAWALMDKSNTRKIVSVEMGGEHLSHPTVPSKDIIADLKKNLAHHKVASRVQIIHGHSRDPQVVSKAAVACDAGAYSLFLLDSDGDVKHDWELYSPQLAPDCLLAFDDYFSPVSWDKELATKGFVDELEREGRIRCFGVYGWGTWIGEICH